MFTIKWLGENYPLVGFLAGIVGSIFWTIHKYLKGQEQIKDNEHQISEARKTIGEIMERVAQLENKVEMLMALIDELKAIAPAIANQSESIVRIEQMCSTTHEEIARLRSTEKELIEKVSALGAKG